MKIISFIWTNLQSINTCVCRIFSPTQPQLGNSGLRKESFPLFQFYEFVLAFMSIQLINRIFPTCPECTIKLKYTLGFSLQLNYNSWLVFGPHSYCFSEMAPVCAVVGGVLGQEIVKVRSLIWSIYLSEVFIVVSFTFLSYVYMKCIF